MRFIKTGRGFARITFQDRSGVGCDIQKSSLATEDTIWFGVIDPEPQVMASQAAQFGIKTDVTTGFVPFPIPKAVSLNTRMHLTVGQAAALIPILQHFVRTGDLPDEMPKEATDA